MMKLNKVSLMLLVVLTTSLIPINMVNAAAVVNSSPNLGTVNTGPSGTFTLDWEVDFTATSGFQAATINVIGFPVGSGFAYTGYTAFDSSLNPLTLTTGGAHNPGAGDIQLTSNTIPVDTCTFSLIFTAPPTGSAGNTFAGTWLFSAGDFPPTTDWSATVNVVASYDVSLDIPTSSESELTGTPIVHTVTITNDGNVADDFTLSYTGDGSVTSYLPVSPISLAVGASQAVDITMTGLSNGANAGTFTATSDNDPAGTPASASATLNSFVETTGVVLSETVTTSPVVDSLDSDVIHTITIQNTGNIADTFNLAVAAGDAGLFGTNPITSLAAGASTTFTFTHEDNPAHGGVDYSKTSTISATSTAGLGSTDTLAGVESQFKNYAVEITPVDPTDSVTVGDPSVVYTFTVENTGGLQDSYDVTVVGDGALSASRIENLDPAATNIITLTHTTAVAGTLVGTVKVESDFNAAIFDTTIATTKVATYGVTLTPDPSTVTVLSGAATAVHTITIQNTGSHTDTFDLTATEGVLSVAQISVGAGATDTFTLTYNAPADGIHTSTVTATSTLDPAATKATDSLTATTAVELYDVSIVCTTSPKTVQFGQNAVHSFTVTNAGNVADTYDLTTTEGTLSAATITLAAGATGTVTVTYTAPAEGLGYSATVTVTSQTEPILSTDAATALTQVHRYRHTVLNANAKALSEKVVLIGGSGVHTFTVTNNGNVPDTFDLTLVGVGTLSGATVGPIAAGATDTFTVTHSTAVEGTFKAVVTVDSQGPSGQVKTVTARTFVVDPASHDTGTATNPTDTIDSELTTRMVLDVVTPAPVTFDLWLHPTDTHPEVRAPVDHELHYATVTTADPTAFTSATISFYYCNDLVLTLDLDESSITPYYWNEVGLVRIASVTRDTVNNIITFAIPAGAWIDRSYDFDFVVAGDETFFPPLVVGPPEDTTPVVDVPDDASDDDVGDAIDAATEGQSDEVVAATILQTTQTKTTEQTANIVAKVTAKKTVEQTATIVKTVTATKTVTETATIVKTVTATKTTAETATIVKKVVESKSGADAGAVVKDVVTGKNSEQASEVVVGVITGRPVVEKATIVQAQTKENAAKTMDKISTADAVEIMDSIIPDTDLDTATDEVKARVENAADMMNEVDKDKAGEMLLQSTSSAKAKNIVQEMAKKDIVKAATRLEEAVKIQKNSGAITVEQKNAYRKQLKDIVEAGDATAMANLFVAIANLPNTPSTVAEIFEIIDISKTMEIVDKVTTQGSYSELALVYSFLSDSKLTEIYTAMTTAARTAIFPYFDAATLGNLPEFTTFTVSVSVSPATVETGDPVTITATVTNTGDETGDIWVTMTEGSTEESEVVTLNAGASTTLTWTITKATAGTYTVDVNGDPASWTVEAPPVPASFISTNLIVIPGDAGEDVTVTVDVENSGEESGSTTVVIIVDGVEVDSELVTLDGGESTTVTITIPGTEGTHTVEVDDLTDEYTIEAPPTGLPWTYILVGIVVVAAAAYYYMQQQKKEE